MRVPHSTCLLLAFGLTLLWGAGIQNENVTYKVKIKYESTYKNIRYWLSKLQMSTQRNITLPFKMPFVKYTIMQKTKMLRGTSKNPCATWFLFIKQCAHRNTTGRKHHLLKCLC